MTTRQYRKFDEDFKQGAVALVVETGKPIAGPLAVSVTWRPGPQTSARICHGLALDQCGNRISPGQRAGLSPGAWITD